MEATYVAHQIHTSTLLCYLNHLASDHLNHPRWPCDKLWRPLLITHIINTNLSSPCNIALSTRNFRRCFTPLDWVLGNSSRYIKVLKTIKVYNMGILFIYKLLKGSSYILFSLDFQPVCHKAYTIFFTVNYL